LHVAALSLVSQMLNCQSAYGGSQALLNACLSTPRMVDRATKVATGLKNTGQQCQWLQVQQRDQIRSGLAWLLEYETNTTTTATSACRTMVLDEIAVLRHRLNTMALFGTAWLAQCQETSSLGEFIANILRTTTLASSLLSEMQARIDKYTLDLPINATLAIQLAKGPAQTYLTLLGNAIQSKIACLNSKSTFVDRSKATAEVTTLRSQSSQVSAAQALVPANFASQISGQFNATYALRLSEVNAIAPCPLAIVHDVMLSDIAVLNQAARYGVQLPDEKSWLALFQVFGQQSMTKYIESKAFYDDVAKSTQVLLNTAAQFQRDAVAQTTTLSQLANATINTWRQKLIVSEAARSTCWTNRLIAFVSYYTNTACTAALPVPTTSSSQPQSWNGIFPCLFECDAVDPTLAWTPSQVCAFLSSSSNELLNGILSTNVTVRTNAYNTHNVPAETLDRTKTATQLQIRTLANKMIATNNLKLGLGPTVLSSYKIIVDELVFQLQHDVVNALDSQSQTWWVLSEWVLVSTYQSYSCQPRVFLHPFEPESPNENYAFSARMAFRDNFDQMYNSKLWLLKSLYLKACRASLQSDLDVQATAYAANPFPTSTTMATVQAQEMQQWQIIERSYIEQGFDYFSKSLIKDIRAQIAVYDENVARRVPIPTGRNLTATEISINYMADLNAIWSNNLNSLLNSTLNTVLAPCSVTQVTGAQSIFETQKLQMMTISMVHKELNRVLIIQKEAQLNELQAKVDQLKLKLLSTSNAATRASLQASIAAAENDLPTSCCTIEKSIEAVLQNFREKELRYWKEIDGVVDYQWNLWQTARAFNSYWVSRALNVTTPPPPAAMQCQRATIIFPLIPKSSAYQPSCCSLCKLPASGSTLPCSRSELCPNGLCCSSARVCGNSAEACGEGTSVFPVSFQCVLVLDTLLQVANLANLHHMYCTIGNRTRLFKSM
jgi:hypothetical protein